MRKALLLITIFTDVQRLRSKCCYCISLARWPSLTRTDRRLYSPFVKSNHCTKLQGDWEAFFSTASQPSHARPKRNLFLLQTLPEMFSFISNYSVVILGGKKALTPLTAIITAILSQHVVHALSMSLLQLCRVCK